MNKVSNKKAIRRLAGKSFCAARTRNIIAVLAITLTALLFTSLFTIGIGSVEAFQWETMRQSGGSSHGVFKNLSREQYKKLRKHPLIKESADCMILADTIHNPEFLKRHMELWYYPEYHYPYCFTEIIDGHAPKEANEILVDEVSMELLGKEPRAGQEITLELQIRMNDKEIVERTFTVSGIIKADPALNVGFAVASEAYLEVYASELTYTYPEDASMVGTIRMDVNFSNSFNIQKKLEKVIVESGYSLDEGSTDYVASNGNWAYISDGRGADPMTVGAVTGGLLLIMATGYLIIYNIFQINSILTSIVTRQREFAMLQAIGMTRKQLSKMLVMEGLYYAGATIIFSLVLGCLFSVTALRILAKGMWFMKYHFVIVPMLLVFPVLVLLGILVPLAAMNIGKKESVVERLRRTE